MLTALFENLTAMILKIYNYKKKTTLESFTVGVKLLSITCKVVVIRGVTKKKLDCINHALGTMPIGKPLAHHETQLLSSIVLQFL